jgi:cellobiose phosphorylase
MYRLVVESLLGLSLEVDRLRFAPCLPPEWNELALRYRYGETYYHIVVRRMHIESDAAMATLSVLVDGAPQPGNVVALADDCQEHHVEVRVPFSRQVPQMSVAPGLAAIS